MRVEEVLTFVFDDDEDADDFDIWCFEEDYMSEAKSATVVEVKLNELDDRDKLMKAAEELGGKLQN